MIFGVRDEHDPEQTTVRLHGEADLAALQTLRDALAEAVGRGLPVEVDCSDLSFLDGGCARALGEARTAARRAGIAFSITNATEMVALVLRVTKTHGVSTERNRSTARRHRTRQRYHTVLSRLASQRMGDPEVDLIDPDFLASADSHTLAEAIIRQATSLAGADASDLQLLNPQMGTLVMQAHRGFRPEFLDYFAEVGGGDPTSCAAALARRSPVIVTDVTQDPIFAGRETLDVVLDAGTRAVESHPLFAADGRVLGVLSLHYHRIIELNSSYHDAPGALVAQAAGDALDRHSGSTA